MHILNDKYENKGKISHFLDGFSLDLVKCLAGEGEKEPPACK